MSWNEDRDNSVLCVFALLWLVLLHSNHNEGNKTASSEGLQNMVWDKAVWSDVFCFPALL
jgi:hypothetical protein